MKNYLSGFRRSEDGAITVDFVVLCAMVVVLALAIVGIYQTQLADTTGWISDEMGDMIGS